MVWCFALVCFVVVERRVVLFFQCLFVACGCGSLVQRNPTNDIWPGVTLDGPRPSGVVQAGVTTNNQSEIPSTTDNSSGSVQIGVTTDNQSEIPSDDLIRVYEPYASDSKEAEYMTEWTLLTKPEKQVSTSERNTLGHLYSQRTYAALITSKGAYSEEKVKYRAWLNWVIRPKGVIEKAWTRMDHKRIRTDQTFLSAIIRRNGPGILVPHNHLIILSYVHRMDQSSRNRLV